MNIISISETAMMVPIIIGLASVPFTASTVLDDYNTTIDNFGIDGDTSNVPQSFTRNMNSNSFEQTIQTAFGKIYVNIKPGRVYEKLTRPDMNVIVEKTPDSTVWELNSQDYELVLKETGVKSVEKFSSPDGYLEKVEEMGNTTERIDGDTDKVRSQYEEAKDRMQKAVDRMKKVKNSLPGHENITSNILINEFVADPGGNSSELIELYNPTESEVNLDGWTIEDNTVDPEGVSGSIPAGGYLLLNKSEGDFGFSLSNGGDIIILRDSEENIVNSITYGDYNDGNVNDNVKAPGDGESVGRCPDGSETWNKFNETSLGGNNC